MSVKKLLPEIKTEVKISDFLFRLAFIYVWKGFFFFKLNLTRFSLQQPFWLQNTSVVTFKSQILIAILPVIMISSFEKCYYH